VRLPSRADDRHLRRDITVSSRIPASSFFPENPGWSRGSPLVPEENAGLHISR
jgi:hypothetical protein